MKNYIGFVNDHSGSMSSLVKAAIADYNANITAVKESASRDMLDTVVSVVGIGLRDPKRGGEVKRQVVISNPHVLKPLDTWPTPGGTPLYDGIGDIIELFKSLPDYDNEDVSFLVMITTDGEELSSKKWNLTAISREIQYLQNTGRWTFVMRVPRGYRHRVMGMGVHSGNIQEWDTTTAGMAASTAATTAAVSSYYSTRSAGAKSTSSFYASASNVNAAQVKSTLTDILSEVSVWTVTPAEDSAEIMPFCQKRLGNSPFLKGAAFYQLNKVEPRVQDTKRILIRDKKSGSVYEGAAARQMIGLPASGTVRVHPGDYSNYDIFIQSTSINRKLVAGSSVIYWPKVGQGFTAADFPWLQNGQANQDPSLLNKAAQAIQATSGGAYAAAVAATPKKTPAGVKVFFDSREAARKSGKQIHDAGANAPKGKRWFVYK